MICVGLTVESLPGLSLQRDNPEIGTSRAGMRSRESCKRDDGTETRGRRRGYDRKSKGKEELRGGPGRGCPGEGRVAA